MRVFGLTLGLAAMVVWAVWHLILEPLGAMPFDMEDKINVIWLLLLGVFLLAVKR
jgi:hypothetical protein